MSPELPRKSANSRRLPLVFSHLLTGAIAVVFGDGLFRLIYGALGQSVGDPAWAYVQVLYGVLGVGSLAAGLTHGSSFLGHEKARSGWQRGSQGIAAIAAGALFGFANLGRGLALIYASLNQPQLATQWEKDAKVAIVGACLGALGFGWMAIQQYWKRQSWEHQSWERQLRLQVILGVMTYGAAFLCSALASNGLSLQQGWLGGSLALLALVYFLSTIAAIRTCLRLVQRALLD
ncbi:hypothetical protein [Alkalinema sp. FACHB-956]|uniref:hypothetical protein n=1 Tax=Alkalinema sp. FACHB-956 TaxID=2692768 RepID=UPI001687A86A|nr:hypothetical protein [Alkalinema sp. FACHB-956]MBD2325282.1 hypothetical protein [Alkalinema sp. FACHB-956]